MRTRLILSVAAALAFAAGTASAVTPSTTEYVEKTQATITGTLVSIDDRLIVLDTDRGQRVTLLMDSRTMLPVNHSPGMGMKIEFRVLENGQYYAERLIPLDNLEVQQVSYRDEDEGEEVATSSVTRGNGDNDEASERATANAGDAAEDQAEANSNAAATSNTALPQTASNQPLIALLGLVALAGAAVLARSRREGSKAS